MDIALRPIANTDAIEAEINAKRHKFDFWSLLRLLKLIGYETRQIRFRSYNTLVSQAGLIRRIRFRKAPKKTVEITLNMGLLSPQSPLPSYFQKMIDTGMMDLDAFFQFINFFDHPLISQFLQAVHPVSDPSLIKDWERTKLDYIKILDLKSPTTLYWFVSLFFPELELRVDKTESSREIFTNPFVLGSAILGDTATFGAKTNIIVQGVKITFFSEEERNNRGAPWPKEIRNRLEKYIFPTLSAVGMDIQIVLVIKYQRAWAKLERGSYLGYDKIRGGTNQLRTIKIFFGHLTT